jgi:nucleoside-diphosphate-sugar epimerase
MIGNALLPMLVESGRLVHAFSRKAHPERQENVAWHQLPSRQVAMPQLQLPRIEEWVCLAPIRVLLERLDLVEACGAKRVVALSSTSRFTKTNSSEPAEQTLVRDLIESEQHLAQWAESRGIEWVVLRPTLVYGYGLDRNISLIAGFISRFGFFPMLGAAHGLRQPVHASDVAYACTASLQRPEAANHAYNISGAEKLSYREMVGRIFAALGQKPRFIRVPLWMFAVAMRLLKTVPRFSKLSPAMAERMNQDMVFGHEEAERDLGFAPRPFVLDRCDLPG